MCTFHSFHFSLHGFCFHLFAVACFMALLLTCNYFLACRFLHEIDVCKVVVYYHSESGCSISAVGDFYVFLFRVVTINNGHLDCPVGGNVLVRIQGRANMKACQCLRLLLYFFPTMHVYLSQLSLQFAWLLLSLICCCLRHGFVISLHAGFCFFSFLIIRLKARLQSHIAFT